LHKLPLWGWSVWTSGFLSGFRIRKFQM
jgi:hypothetical protein